MKIPKAILVLLSFLVCGLSSAQEGKTITVVIKDFGEACGQDPGDAAFCLTDVKGNVIKERYSCNMDNNVWRVEPQDLITKEWVLNPKYKGKKATIYCTKAAGGAGWIVERAEFGEQSVKNSSSAKSENELDKYVGVYVFLKYKITVNKFPVTSKVKAQTSSKYVPLDKKYIGKYFLVDDYGTHSDTSKIFAAIGGYIAPPEGNLLLSVDKGGEITIQNYNNYGTTGNENTMDFKLGGTGVYGKFVLRDDGKYDLIVNNARYAWTKIN